VDQPAGLTAATDDALAGFFFQASHSARPSPEPQIDEGLSREVQELVTALEENDQQLASTSSTRDIAQLNAKRADLLEKLASRSQGEDRDVWLRQLADSVSAAVQSGAYPDGTQRLEKLYDSLSKESADQDLLGYVKFRYMSSAYTTSLQDPQADFAEIQESWLKSLEEFVDDFSRSNDAAEAMLQLAIAQEFAGEEDQARRWYQRIVSDFPSNTIAAKARGAVRRIDSVGKSVPIRGRSLQGKTVDLATYRGKLVLVHYWATWCEPCKQDMDTLKQLYAKYGRDGFSLIGVSLDSEPQTVSGYLRSNRIAWPQIYEDGGLDSRLATEMGVFTLPVMLLVDESGRVINRNIHVSQLEAELQKRKK
jgi:thiol-disulfide isomerase/thioredoxin